MSSIRTPGFRSRNTARLLGDQQTKALRALHGRKSSRLRSSMSSTDGYGPDPIDVAVGLRLLNLRKSAGMPQEVLGRHLGVKFQQSQKYEKGTNRISASMLVKAARALGVTPTALLPEEGEAGAYRPAVLDIIAKMNCVEELVETFSRIKSPRLRRAVLQLTRSLASSTNDE